LRVKRRQDGAAERIVPAPPPRADAAEPPGGRTLVFQSIKAERFHGEGEQFPIQSARYEPERDSVLADQLHVDPMSTSYRLPPRALFGHSLGGNRARVQNASTTRVDFLSRNIALAQLHCTNPASK
jgi:hypothetical protein